MQNQWNKVRVALRALAAEAASASIPEVSLGQSGEPISIESPISGVNFEMRVSRMLNGTGTVDFEAERSYLFGLLFRSMYCIVEFPPDGEVVVNQIVSRFESRKVRETRRNWCKDDA